jgi:hypothetical protein
VRKVKAAGSSPCYTLAMNVILLRFALAIWAGGGLSVALGTRSIFRAAETRRQGGLFSGAVLGRFLELRWAAVALTVVAWAFQRTPGLWWATAAAALTLAQAPLDARIRALREQLGGSTEGLDRSDPRRKRWGALHGASVLILFAQIACAAAGLVVAA